MFYIFSCLNKSLTQKMLKTDCLNMYTICVKIKLSKKEGMIYPGLLLTKVRSALSEPAEGNNSRNASCVLHFMPICLLLAPYYHISTNVFLNS